MKKKGFTLIELLAVIVILAVIALIATPAVLNIIEDSKKSAAEASARSIVGAAKTHYMQNIMDNKPNSNVDLSTNTLKYDGEQAKKGLLSYDANGNVSGKMYISGYCVEVALDGAITSTKTNESECTIDIPQVTTYTNGTVVYYNPETNKKCSNSEAVSTTGTKTGCMKWYTFNDEGTDTVNLLLDHNTTATVAWNSSGNNADGMNEVATALVTDTQGWQGSPRLITANEVARITGNTGFDASQTGMGWFCLDTNAPDDTNYCAKAEGTSAYKWLFDNTIECTSYGCDIADDSTYGYWTSTPYAGDTLYAWYVDSNGYLSDRYVAYDDIYGVRPVITVSKDIFE